MQQADVGGALQPVPVVFRDSVPAPCRRGGGGVMEPINRRTEHERSRLLYIRPVLAEAAEYRSSSILCGDLEIWNVQAVFFPMICLNYFLWVCIMAI